MRDNQKLIYLDNAATTKMLPECAEIFKDISCNSFFNSAALYKQASDISNDIKVAKKTIMNALGNPDGDLIFTSGGTESDNLALLGLSLGKNARIIVSIGEHDAVIAPANELKSKGYDVVFAPILADGSVDEIEFQKLLTPSVALVSIMSVSNETGAINNIQRLCKMTKRVAPKAIFHSDGVQAFTKIKTNLRQLDIDMFSISAHKIHGPKGIGALFVRKGVNLKPIMFGGGQQKGLRSGTENTAGILSFAKAVEIAQNEFSKSADFEREYTARLAKELVFKMPDVKIVTNLQNSAPHILTVALKSVRGEVVLHSIEKHGILAGIGSACSSHHESRFKKLLMLDDDYRDGIMRFSVSKFNSIDEIDAVVSAIATETEILGKFRRV